MRVTLLGTGTPTPSLRRQGSSLLVEAGGDSIVLDHGPGAHHRLLESGRRATDVTHLVFSHLHYDHCCDYARLLLTRWDQGAGRIPELEVLGPPPLARMTEQLFAPDGVFGPDLQARIAHPGSLDVYAARGGVLPRRRPAPAVRELAPGDTIAGRGWRLTVAEGWHVQPYLRCYGYRIDTEEASLCYSGDSGGVCPAIVSLAQGCDILIHMTHFMTGTEPSADYRRVCGNHLDTAEVAHRAGVGTLVLTHMLEQIDQPGIRERIIAEMSRIFGGAIVWGEDLLEIPLGGPRLARLD